MVIWLVPDFWIRSFPLRFTEVLMRYANMYANIVAVTHAIWLFLYVCVLMAMVLGCITMMADMFIGNNFGSNFTRSHYFLVVVAGLTMIGITIVTNKLWSGCPMTILENALRSSADPDYYVPMDSYVSKLAHIHLGVTIQPEAVEASLLASFVGGIVCSVTLLVSQLF